MALNLEDLIHTATSPLNKEDNPNAIQGVCQAVSADPSGIPVAVRLIVHKIQSPQEREALQALTVLQACVNNCGPAFHAEIGKFRFLNEMIKLVSPKFLGNHTSSLVKKKTLELLYSWTIDLKSEPKIGEAYAMLKKQDIIQEDPAYLGAPVQPAPRPRPSPFMEDEEKSHLLQKLLQSKKPEDVHKANALIKMMVKEDEKRTERSTRRIMEVETAMNNTKVLEDMLNQHQQTGCASQADLDLMAELYSSCVNLKTSVYRLVSEMDDKDEGIGDLLRANDELSNVLGHYKLVMNGGVRERLPSGGLATNTSLPKPHEEDMLLDLSVSEMSPKTTNCYLDYLDLDLASTSVTSTEESMLQGTTPGTVCSSEGLSAIDDLQTLITPLAEEEDPAAIGLDILCPSHAVESTMPAPVVLLSASISKPDIIKESGIEKPHLNSLDELSINLLKQNLPPNVSPGSQFSVQEKLSMNQLRQQRHSYKSVPTGDAKASVNCSVTSVLLEEQCSHAVPSSTLKMPSCNVDLLENLVGGSRTRKSPSPENPLSSTTSSTASSPSSTSSMVTTLACETNDQVVKPAEEKLHLPSLLQVASAPKVQLVEAKPLLGINISLENIKPGQHTPIKLLENNHISLVLHFTENRPREDVYVLVASTVSRNISPLSSYFLQAVVPKGCKVHLLPPSSTELASYSPFLPPPAITQILLIANPNQLNVSLKVVLSYAIEEDLFTEKGEISNLPL